jgi:hypothetical protein
MCFNTFLGVADIRFGVKMFRFLARLQAVSKSAAREKPQKVYTQICIQPIRIPAVRIQAMIP